MFVTCRGERGTSPYEAVVLRLQGSYLLIFEAFVKFVFLLECRKCAFINSGGAPLKTLPRAL